MTEKMPPAYIAFQGGGALGMAHLGAWKVISQHFNIKGVAGTSAGSIVAAFCAAGFDPNHTIDIFDQLNWSKYVKHQKILNILINRDGLSDGEDFRKWLRDQLKRRVSDELQDISFNDIYKATNIYLAIVACDLNAKQPIVFDKDNRPNDFVSFAVRASISIPGFFTPISIPNTGQVLVDGGLLLNYPIELLHEQAQKARSVLIGVRFKGKPTYLENPKIWQTSQASLQAMQQAGNVPSDKIIKDANYIEIEIDVQDFDFLNFNLTKEKKSELVRLGENATELALSKWKLQPQSQYHKREPQSQTYKPDLRYYVERPPIEANCDNEILRSGALIRIKAPNKMGKTSLINRTLAHLPQEYRIVYFSIGSIEQNILNNLKDFLYSLCSTVSNKLNLENRLGDYWDAEIVSNNDNCTAYFEEYLLPDKDFPLVLAIDDVDKIFSHREVAEDFFGMLRHWYEMGKLYENWQKFRLVLAHSTEVYVPLDINQSPFNVGISVELSEFTQQQVLDLAQRYKLHWQDEQVRDLMALVGGHPDLVCKAVEYVSRQQVPLETLLKNASTEAGIYSNHLRHHLENLEAVSELKEAFKRVVTSSTPVELDSKQIYKLHSMGLVQLQNNCVTPRCNLYREYFTRVLK
ncbi:MAG: AAA-like domain-containing protein [Rhizonema sp. PD37]|nr:AAA-like domain-containing protein [Rhizonema sp. PD37]